MTSLATPHLPLISSAVALLLQGDLGTNLRWEVVTLEEEYGRTHLLHFASFAVVAAAAAAYFFFGVVFGLC